MKQQTREKNRIQYSHSLPLGVGNARPMNCVYTNPACVWLSKFEEHRLSLCRNDWTVSAIPCCLILTWNSKRAEEGWALGLVYHRLTPTPSGFTWRFYQDFLPVPIIWRRSPHQPTPGPIRAAGPVLHRWLQLGLCCCLVAFSVTCPPLLRPKSLCGAVFNPCETSISPRYLVPGKSFTPSHPFRRHRLPGAGRARLTCAFPHLDLSHFVSHSPLYEPLLPWGIVE